MPDDKSIACIYVNDTYQLTSTAYDAQHLSLLLHLLGYGRIVTVSNKPILVTGELQIGDTIVDLTGYTDIVISLNMDIQIGRSLVNRIKSNLPPARILILLDMCESGTIFGYPYIYPNPIIGPPTNSVIVTLSSVSNTELDSDDISELGFGGGLTDQLVDYLIGPTNLEPKELLQELIEGTFKPIQDTIHVVEFFTLLQKRVSTTPTMTSNIPQGWRIYNLE